MFVCTYVLKDVCVDDFERGEEIKRTQILSEQLNITAKTFSDLVKNIGDRFGLEIKEIDFCSDLEGDSTKHEWFEFSRLETYDGEEPQESTKIRWREGRCKLYSAYYVFDVEKRITLPITQKTFERFNANQEAMRVAVIKKKPEKKHHEFRNYDLWDTARELKNLADANDGIYNRLDTIASHLDPQYDDRMDKLIEIGERIAVALESLVEMRESCQKKEKT